MHALNIQLCITNTLGQTNRTAAVTYREVDKSIRVRFAEYTGNIGRRA